MTLKLENGNCLELMKTLPDKSIDLFICDLPYTDMKGKGETNCKWNQSAIDLEQFWIQFKRLRKTKKVACIHFCSSKFGYTLIKSNEKMFKMDMVWVKRNKTGGLQSRHRPMRNHEMVYFFYEQAPKYNRDKYHKRIKLYPHKKENGKDPFGNNNIGVTVKESGFGSNFDPPNPASVLDDKEGKNEFGWDKSVVKEKGNKVGKIGGNFEPVNPVSVVEEKELTPKQLRDKTYSTRAKEGKDIFGNNDTRVKPFNYDPPNPASVIEEKFCKEYYQTNKTGMTKTDIYSKENIKQYHKENGVGFSPPNPASVVEDEPGTIFKSNKVFIGKRHHQTEKPLDILEFFLKYWSDEGDTILDPTMGSGSVGVACKKLNRNFIGYELDEKIFKVAEDRIAK